MDKYTFQYADLRRGNAAAVALATVASEFVRGFSNMSHYEDMLNAIVKHLSEKESAQVEDAWRALNASLSERQHALLEEERARERRPKKLWGAAKAVRDVINDSSDEDEATAGFTEEDLKRREEERLEAEKAAEAEWERIQRKADELAQQKAKNEAILAAKARKVDAKALEEKLKQGGVVLLNPGDTKSKKGDGKGGKGQTLTPEEVGNLHKEVAETMHEKETLKAVLATVDEEMPAKIAEAKAELAKAEAAAKAAGDLTNKKATDATKGQITQLQQKLSKQSIEKNRLALQIKALEPNAQRDELIEILSKVDKLMVAIELAQA